MLESNSILDCLQKQIDLINSSTCRREILYLSEIQGENYRMDHSLLASCSIERLKFCSDVPGNEEVQVYKCLQEFNNDPIMSSQVVPTFFVETFQNNLHFLSHKTCYSAAKNYLKGRNWFRKI